MLAAILLPGIALADQPVPFAPLGNVTGNYTLTQGIDTMKINTNMPVSSQDIVYSETVWETIILIGIAFLFLAVIFASFADSVPWISMLMCGVITAGTEAAAAYMTPYVGYTQVYQQIIATASSGTVTLGSANTLYVNEVIVYTQGIFAAYACAGLAMAGVVVIIAAVGFEYGWLHARGIKQAQKGDYLLPSDTEQDPDTVDFRKRVPRK